MAKIPKTRPNWISGKYSVLLGDEHQGYFRTYMGAWNWKEFLLSRAPVGIELRIQAHGQTISIEVKRASEEPLI